MKKFLWGLLIICAIIFFHKIGWLGFVENGISRLFNPLLTFVNKQNIYRKEIFEVWGKRNEMYRTEKDLEEFKIEVKRLEAEKLLAKEENKILRQQLKFFTVRDLYRWSVCNVVGTGFELGQSSIIIDCGEQSNIKVGQGIVAGEGVFVGKVVKVEKAHSVVRLISDAKSKNGAAVLNGAGSVGVLEGGFGVGVKLKFIPEGESVKIGDIIVTSGLEELIPRGLVIGEVETVEKEIYEPFQSAIIKPFLDLNKLLVVSVILSEKKKE